MNPEVYCFADLERWEEAASDRRPALRLAVFGDPVAHSASPPMHNAALDHCGIQLHYTRLHIRQEELAAALALLPAQGFLGVNLTIPHKVAALPLLHRVDEHAARVGAVNTVVVQGEELAGFNTDGPGLVRALRGEFGVDLRDMRVLLLGGGGGAGRAIAVQCGLERCERLAIANRTPEKVQGLLSELKPLFEGTRVLGPVERLCSVSWDEEALRFQLEHTDLVINCTSLGLQASDPSPLAAALLSPHHLVFDTVYTASRTRLVQAAEDVGARAVNGLGMLLHQGALAFEIWFGKPAPVEVMRAALLGIRG